MWWRDIKQTIYKQSTEPTQTEQKIRPKPNKWTELKRNICLPELSWTEKFLDWFGSVWVDPELNKPHYMILRFYFFYFGFKIELDFKIIYVVIIIIIIIIRVTAQRSKKLGTANISN